MGDDMELSKIYPGKLGHDVFVIKENFYLGVSSSSLKIAMISYWSLLFPLSCKILVDFLLC
jgi:hypothetical protein